MIEISQKFLKYIPENSIIGYTLDGEFKEVIVMGYTEKGTPIIYSEDRSSLFLIPSPSYVCIDESDLDQFLISLFSENSEVKVTVDKCIWFVEKLRYKDGNLVLEKGYKYRSDFYGPRKELQIYCDGEKCGISEYWTFVREIQKRHIKFEASWSL